MRVGADNGRNAGFHETYAPWLGRALAAAAIVHVVVVGFFVAPSRSDGFVSGGEDLLVIEMPPETKIPPPPEEIARPATPVVASEPVDEEITIAETMIELDQPVPEGPPAPSAPAVVTAESTDHFTFTPYTERPRCRSGCAPEEIVRHVPPVARRAGLACEMTVGIRIDREGNVTATDLLAPSGRAVCDAAVRAWAAETRWSPAFNRDEPVVVWIAQPVQIVVE